ncbi:HNH endonuclease [Algoriphagus sp.]|uniref:HNH endonuclease n=1 Tax=Algoriphagus sp. TaxID=1872435 RepID=UPI00391B99EB
MTEFQIQPHKEAYQEALLDRRWRELREAILDRDRHQCRSCGSQTSLHVHHRQYHRIKTTGIWIKPWEYPEYLLITLCHSCHQTGHQQFSIPIKDI